MSWRSIVVITIVPFIGILMLFQNSFYQQDFSNYKLLFEEVRWISDLNELVGPEQLKNFKNKAELQIDCSKTHGGIHHWHQIITGSKTPVAYNEIMRMTGSKKSPNKKYVLKMSLTSVGPYANICITARTIHDKKEFERRLGNSEIVTYANTEEQYQKCKSEDKIIFVRANKRFNLNLFDN